MARRAVPGDEDRRAAGAGRRFIALTAVVRGAIVAVAGLLLAAACTREAGPETTAIDYARALYVRDLARIHALVTREDRQAKPEAAFRIGEPTGFALELGRQLASFITSTLVEARRDSARARVTLALRVPDARAAAIAGIVPHWDARVLNALAAFERTFVTQRLDELHRTARLPMIEGQQAFALSREDGAWKVHAEWAGGAHVRFAATTGTLLPLEVAVRRVQVTAPARHGGWIADALPLTVATGNREVVLAPGERVQVVLAARNGSGRPVVARAGHRVEPKGHAEALAIMRCPLLVPVTLAAGASDEYVSEYLLVPLSSTAPPLVSVTYDIQPIGR